MKLVAIKNIKTKKYKGKVYDLTVDKDHSYNINGIIVHNSLCTTREKTGFGIPSVSALIDVASYSTVPIIADGGLRSSGDIAKALAIGGDTVMLGSMLAGTQEAPGEIIYTNNALFKRYRGSASLETKIDNNKETRNVEGESTIVPFKGGVKFVVYDLLDGIRSALSYAGADNLSEFMPEWIEVTQASQREARPHLIR